MNKMLMDGKICKKAKTLMDSKIQKQEIKS